MHLRHLGLPVRDQLGSLGFYATYFGFDLATTRWYPDGTVIVANADGFDLALHPTTQTPPASTFLHFGFTMPDADEVTTLRDQLEREGVPVLEREGVPVLERDDDPALVSFTYLDPDGWRVQAYWEESRSPP